jgi:hypothetical protein
MKDDLDDDFGICDCAYCQPELYPAEPMDEPFTAPVDNDDDAPADGEAPADVDAAFDTIFGLSDRELEALYPYNVNFSEGEIRSISAALRSQGTELAKGSVAVLSGMDAYSLPREAYETALATVTEALDESERCLDLYDWFSDQFGISE